MKIFLIVFSFLLVSVGVCAQGPGAKREKIRQARKEYIGNRLNLSASQEKKFWETYDAYSDEKMDLQIQKRKLRIESVNLTATDQELLAAVDQMIEISQKEVDLEKKYLTKFKAFLNPRQLVEMYKSDRDFNKLLLSKLKELND